MVAKTRPVKTIKYKQRLGDIKNYIPGRHPGYPGVCDRRYRFETPKT